MMRNNDFEALVQARTALKTKVIVKPTPSVTADRMQQMIEEEDFDPAFAPSRAVSKAALQRLPQDEEEQQ